MTIDLHHVATLLDRSINLFETPISQEKRAAIFAAIDSPSMETWKAARNTLVAPHTTLWKATHAAGMAGEVPTAQEIIRGLESATS